MRHNRKKKEMQRSVDRRPNRTSTVTGEEERREVQIRKESCTHQGKHTQAGGWLSMFTLSQLAKRISKPPPARLPARSPGPHAAGEQF